MDETSTPRRTVHTPRPSTPGRLVCYLTLALVAAATATACAASDGSQPADVAKSNATRPGPTPGVTGPSASDPPAADEAGEPGGKDPAEAAASSAAPTVRAPEPSFSELENATDYEETPVPMALEPDVGTVADLASAGDSRRDAESFAVAFAQLQSDTRQGRDQDAFLSGTLSSEADPELRTYLLQDYELQRQLATDRHYDPRDEVWVRSAIEGDPESPTRVSVEIAAVLISEPLELRFANRTRLDVVRESGSWRVASYAWSVTGSNLSPTQAADLRSGRHGSGWRRLG